MDIIKPKNINKINKEELENINNYFDLVSLPIFCGISGVASADEACIAIDQKYLNILNNDVACLYKSHISLKRVNNVELYLRKDWFKRYFDVCLSQCIEMELDFSNSTETVQALVLEKSQKNSLQGKKPIL